MSNQPPNESNITHLPALPGQNQSRALQPYDPYTVEYPADDEINLRELWSILVKYRWTILVFMAFVLTVTTIGTLLMHPVYQATTLLEIVPNARNIVKFQNLEQMEYQPREFAQTQANILRSESVAAATIANLGIEEHPEMNGELEQRGIMNGARQLRSLFSTSEQATEEYVQRIAERGRLERFTKRLSVEPLRNSNLFKVSFKSFSPTLAADVTNAVAREYLRLHDERRFDSTSGAKTFLEKEIRNIQGKLESSEKELNEFARKRRIIDVEDKGNIMTTRLEELSKSLTQVQSLRINAESLFRQAKKGDINALPAILDEELIKRLKEEYTRLSGEYSRQAKIYKEAYPKLQQLRSQRDRIKSSLDQEIGRMVASLRNNYEHLLNRERLLERAVQAQKEELLNLQDRAVQYNILKREWETNKELYSALLERMKEVGVVAGMETNNISVIDPALVPIRAHSPKLLLNLGVAGILSLMGGIGLAFLLAYLDNTVRTPDELERAVHIVNLGLLPKTNGKVTAANLKLDLVSELHREHEISEAFRSVRTSLMFSSPQGAPKSILITSATPSEGKTTFATNLAIVLSQNGSKVLLIDGDLRKPRLHKIFGVPTSPGLSDWLVGVHQNPMYRTDVQNLFIMASGTSPPNPTELLSSLNMDNFLKQADERFEYVILDSPPTLGLADAIVLSTKVKGVILVAAAGLASKDALKESVKRLRAVRAPIIGAVLNMVEMTRGQYRYYVDSYYQYQGDTSSETDEELAATASR